MNVQPVVTDRLDVLVHFLPSEWRLVRRSGIELWSLRYWHPDLEDYVGTSKAQEIFYDPRDISWVFVRGSDGRIRVCALKTPGVERMSLYEWNNHKRMRAERANDPAEIALRDAGIAPKDEIVRKAKKDTAAAHRLMARELERLEAAKSIQAPTNADVAAGDAESVDRQDSIHGWDGMPFDVDFLN